MSDLEGVRLAGRPRRKRRIKIAREEGRRIVNDVLSPVSPGPMVESPCPFCRVGYRRHEKNNTDRHFHTVVVECWEEIG